LCSVDPDLLRSYQQKLSVLREVLRNEDEVSAKRVKERWSVYVIPRTVYS